jgi:hypothetical protein
MSHTPESTKSHVYALRKYKSNSDVRPKTNVSDTQKYRYMYKQERSDAEQVKGIPPYHSGVVIFHYRNEYIGLHERSGIHYHELASRLFSSRLVSCVLHLSQPYTGPSQSIFTLLHTSDCDGIRNDAGSRSSGSLLVSLSFVLQYPSPHRPLPYVSHPPVYAC